MIDYLLNNEWQHLIEVQTIQLSLLEELQKQIDALELVVREKNHNEKGI